MEKLNERELENICNRLSELGEAMESMGIVFSAMNYELVLRENQLHGIGGLFKVFSREIQRLEGILSHGCDYAKTEFGDDEAQVSNQ